MAEAVAVMRDSSRRCDVESGSGDSEDDLSVSSLRGNKRGGSDTVPRGAAGRLQGVAATRRES